MMTFLVVERMLSSFHSLEGEAHRMGVSSTSQDGRETPGGQSVLVVSVGVPDLEPSPLGALVPDLRSVLFYAQVHARPPEGLLPTMLDVACGSGRHVVQAMQAGWDVVALEASPDLLGYTTERARRQGLACLPELGTIHSYAGPSAAFDLVVVAGAAVEEVDSVIDLTLTIERAARLLRPSGVLLLGAALDGAISDHLESALVSGGLEPISVPLERRDRPGLVGYALARRPEVPAT